MERIRSIACEFLQPQQIDRASVSVPRSPAVAAAVQQLCQRYDLRPLVDVDKLAQAVAASGGDAAGARSLSGGGNAAGLSGVRADPS